MAPGFPISDPESPTHTESDDDEAPPEPDMDDDLSLDNDIEDVQSQDNDIEDVQSQDNDMDDYQSQANDMDDDLSQDTDSADPLVQLSAAPAETGTGGPPQWSNVLRMLRSLELEGQFLIVPLKRYKKLIKANYSFALHEINAVTSAVDEVADGDVSLDETVNVLGTFASRLGDLRTKLELEDGMFNEELQAKRFMARYLHLKKPKMDNIMKWNRIRVFRILADYLLRMSYRETTIMLTEAIEIQELVDIEEIDEANRVISALQKKDLAPALAWCANNSHKLTKSQSKLELNLRLQEFIEFVRAENTSEAITYAKKYLASFGTKDMKDLQRVLGTLAFRSTTQLSRYKVFFEEKQWDRLIDQFKCEYYKLHGMTPEPLLSIYLQAGLVALKTPMSYKDDCAKEDPLSHESFRKLAYPLPFRKELPITRLVCHITKLPMDFSWNRTYILPNRHVYGSQAIDAMYWQNDGDITCPKTGDVCKYEDVMKPTEHSRDWEDFLKGL